MNFFKILEKIKKKDASLIIYSLLDRVPILVFGENQEKVDNFLIELSELIHFRKELVFSTDFITKQEYDDFLNNEDIDFNCQRTHIRCPSNVSKNALEKFDDFKSWIIGVKEGKHKISTNKVKKYLSIYLSKNNINITPIGLEMKRYHHFLENKILQKVSQDTEKSITRMERVLLEKLRSKEIEKDFIKTLLDFEVEKNELKKNIFKEEIQNFYSGAKRAFFILNRLYILNDLNINAKIGSKTLLESIDYAEVPIERMLSFIEREWGINFSNLIENGKKIIVGDKIQSFWG